jgi:hypothetical protein
MKIKTIPILLILFTITANIAFAFIQTDGNLKPENADNIQISEHISIAFMISILMMKITAFILGYMIVKLGHDTLVKGITGEFDFGFSGSGFSTKLKSASPGLFFVLMGSAIIIWSMVVEKPLKITTTPSETIEKKTISTETEVQEGRDIIPDAETFDTIK